MIMIRLRYSFLTYSILYTHTLVIYHLLINVVHIVHDRLVRQLHMIMGHEHLVPVLYSYT